MAGMHLCGTYEVLSGYGKRRKMKGRAEMKIWKLLFIVLIVAVLTCGCANENVKSKMENRLEFSTEEDDSAGQSGQTVFLLPEASSTEEINRVKELGEIPKLSYCSVSELNIGDNYICYKDILILGNTIYKKEAEKYVRQEMTLNAILGMGDELRAVDARQYKNLIVAVSEDCTSFLIYDMDTHSRYCRYRVKEDMRIGPFWCIYGGCIYYSEWDQQYEKERTLKKMDLFGGGAEEIYRPENRRGEDCVFGEFGIRNDGTIMYKIYNKAEGCSEYWIAETDGNGEWNGRKVWENNGWEFEHVLDFNQYGLIVVGVSDISSDYEVVVIKDDGETVKLDANAIYGKYLFMDSGYFSSNSAELECMPWDDDNAASEWLSRNLTDSVSFHDYEGNKLYTYRMVGKELLEQGYYLKKLTWHDGKLMGFYVQRDTDELYISQVEADIETESHMSITQVISDYLLMDSLEFQEKYDKDELYENGILYCNKDAWKYDGSQSDAFQDEFYDVDDITAIRFYDRQSVPVYLNLNIGDQLEYYGEKIKIDCHTDYAVSIYNTPCIQEISFVKIKLDRGTAPGDLYHFIENNYYEVRENLKDETWVLSPDGEKAACVSNGALPRHPAQIFIWHKGSKPYTVFRRTWEHRIVGWIDNDHLVCYAVDMDAPVLLHLERNEIEPVESGKCKYDTYGAEYEMQGNRLIAQGFGEQLFQWDIVERDGEVFIVGLE